MKKSTWNLTIFSAIVLLGLALLPFITAFGLFDSEPFGVFDDNFQPFSDTVGQPATGNPAGPDVIAPGTGVDLNTGQSTQPEGSFPIAVPPTTPAPTPIPVPQPTPQPSQPSGSDINLRIFIRQIFLNDPFEQLPGNQVPLYITFENDGNKRLENAKVLVNIPDLAVRAAFGPFDLSVGKHVTKVLVLELPEDAQPGVYPVRLQIYSVGAQRIVHRELEIIDYS
jgi:hypothetical protein